MIKTKIRLRVKNRVAKMKMTKVVILILINHLLVLLLYGEAMNVHNTILIIQMIAI